MFYKREELGNIYIRDDKIQGEFWPFLWACCKNYLYWENLHNIDLKKYPWYKFALWFTEKRVFVLDSDSNLEILTFKK